MKKCKKIFVGILVLMLVTISVPFVMPSSNNIIEASKANKFYLDEGSWLYVNPDGGYSTNDSWYGAYDENNIVTNSWRYCLYHIDSVGSYYYSNVNHLGWYHCTIDGLSGWVPTTKVAYGDDWI